MRITLERISNGTPIRVGDYLTDRAGVLYKVAGIKPARNGKVIGLFLVIPDIFEPEEPNPLGSPMPIWIPTQEIHEWSENHMVANWHNTKYTLTFKVVSPIPAGDSFRVDLKYFVMQAMRGINEQPRNSKYEFVIKEE